MDTAIGEATWTRLEQISDALGIPVTLFLSPPAEPVSTDVAAKQEEELLQLFREIHDPGTRTRLLDCMQAAAGRISSCKRAD